MKRWLGMALAAVSLAACSVTEPVIGMMGDGSELFRGSATGYVGGHGDISLSGAVSGIRCFGGFTFSRITSGAGSTGIADIQCDDGRATRVKFVSEAYNRGRGVGVDNFGNPFFFAYGMSDEEAAEAFKKMKATFDAEFGTRDKLAPSKASGQSKI